MSINASTVGTGASASDVGANASTVGANINANAVVLMKALQLPVAVLQQQVAA